MELKALIPWLASAAVFSAAVTIAAHYTRPPRWVLVRIFKPLTTILILIIALLPGTVTADAYARAIALGLLFSLAGDIFLVLPDRYFLYGLAAFLLAHGCYISAFHAGASSAGFPWALAVLLLIGAGVLGYLWNRLSPVMKGAVGVYVIVIVLMAALAVGRAVGQPSRGSLLAGVGALLFVASDGMLAVNRFGRPIRGEQALVLMTYFAAQLLITISVSSA